MSHNARIFGDSVYVNGSPVPAVYFQGIDTAQFKSWNGDAGGTWTPTLAIVVSGAGVWFAGVWTMTGAFVVNGISTSASVVHGDSDWFQLQLGHVGSIRNLVTPLGFGLDLSIAATVSGNFIVPLFSYNGANDGTIVTSEPQAGGTTRLVCPISVHHGAVFVSVSFRLVVSAAHNGVGSPPASMPMFRVFKVDVLGNTTNLFTSAATPGWVGNGFVQVSSPASGTAWYNAGATQTFTYTCDPSVTVDTSQFSYYCEIIDEQGANSFTGNVYLCAVATMNGIPDLRPQ